VEPGRRSGLHRELVLRHQDPDLLPRLSTSRGFEWFNGFFKALPIELSDGILTIAREALEKTIQTI
jgi:hypothetical protein